MTAQAKSSPRRERQLERLNRWREHQHRAQWARDFQRAKSGAYLLARERDGKAITPFNLAELGLHVREFRDAAYTLLGLVVQVALKWDKTGIVATLEQLGELLGCSASTVERSLVDLAGAGYLDVRSSFGVWCNGVFTPGGRKSDGRSQDQGPNWLVPGPLLRTLWLQHQRSRAEPRRIDDPSDLLRSPTGGCNTGGTARADTGPVDKSVSGPSGPTLSKHKCEAKDCAEFTKRGRTYCSVKCNNREFKRKFGTEPGGSRRGCERPPAPEDVAPKAPRSPVVAISSAQTMPAHPEALGLANAIADAFARGDERSVAELGRQLELATGPDWQKFRLVPQ